MPHFEYLEPTTLQEAVDLLDHYGNEARPLAGGTDLLPRIRQRLIRPQCVVNIKHIPDLNYISYDRHEGLRIGALATVRDMETSAVVRENFPLLAEGAQALGSVQIRNLATVVGNLCNASPAADTAPPLLALAAHLLIKSPAGERVVPLNTFFVGPGETALKPGDLVIEIRVPSPPPHSGGTYIKLGVRRAMDLSFAGVAALVTREPGDGVCREARLAMGAVAPTPRRAPVAEAMLTGQRMSADLLDRVGEAIAGEVCPISDVRCSADYRREMVKVLTRRSVRRAFEAAGQ
jgi:CO/xanthine dehydrogenase FAD-binding subunit